MNYVQIRYFRHKKKDLDIKPEFIFVCFCVNPVSDIAAEVAGYADVAKQIIDLAVFGAAKSRSYRRLADFTDTIGNRVSGSHNLEMAIKYMYNAMTQDGLDVHLGEYVPCYLSCWMQDVRSVR